MLQDVCMVQSEINGIFNQGINMSKLEIAGTRTNVTAPKEHSETTLSYVCVDQQGKKLPLDSSSEECANIDTGNFCTHNCSPYSVSLKNKVNGNTETPPKPTACQDLFSLQKANRILDHGNCRIFIPCISLKSKDLPPVTKVVSEEINGSLSFAEKDDNIWDILEKIGSSTNLMKQVVLKSHEREEMLALELQYLRHLNGDQSNKSGEVLEQNLEQVISKTVASLKHKEYIVNKNSQLTKIIELEAIEDKLQAVIFSLQEENLSSVQTDGRNDCWCLLCDGHRSKENPEDLKEENKKSEFGNIDECVSKCHVKVVAKLIKAKLVLLDHLQQLQKEKEEQIQMTDQQLKKLKEQNMYDESTADDKCAMKIQHLQNSIQDLHHSESNEQELEKENIDLKTKIKQLSVTVQSLKNDNSNYKEIINTLSEEKNIIQTQFIKNIEDSKQYVNELKTLQKKFEDLIEQKRELQKEKNQLFIQNQHMTWALSDSRSQNQKLQEEICSLTMERNKLMHLLESVKKHSLHIEESQILDLKTNELYKEKNLLENQLEKYKLQGQQLKDKEASMKYEQKVCLQLSREAKNNKVKLKTAFQDFDNARTALKKEIEQVRSDNSFSDEKLQVCHELKNTKAKNEILENGLLDMIRECQELSTMASSLSGENKILKRELQKHIKENLKSQLHARRLSEGQKLFENYLRTVENERDVLQFEVQHLHRDYIKLTNQITVLLGKPYKSNCIYTGQAIISGPPSEKKYHLGEAIENFKGSSDCRHNTIVYPSKGFEESRM